LEGGEVGGKEGGRKGRTKGRKKGEGGRGRKVEWDWGRKGGKLNHLSFKFSYRMAVPH